MGKVVRGVKDVTGEWVDVYYRVWVGGYLVQPSSGRDERNTTNLALM